MAISTVPQYLCNLPVQSIRRLSHLIDVPTCYAIILLPSRLVNSSPSICVIPLLPPKLPLMAPMSADAWLFSQVNTLISQTLGASSRAFSKALPKER